MTKLFTITVDGTEMGQYEASSADEAILAYVNDAGYDTVDQAAEVCGQDAEEFLADIQVSE